MPDFMLKFITIEDGAITLDWAVLSAGLVVMAAATVLVVGDGTQNASNSVRDTVKLVSVK